MEWFESLEADTVRRPGPRRSRWDRWLVAVGAVTLLGCMTFLFLPLARQRQSMESQLQKLDLELKTQQARGRQLRREIEALQNDPEYIERVARDKLNLAAPGETVFQFEPGSAVPAGSRPQGAR